MNPSQHQPFANQPPYQPPPQNAPSYQGYQGQPGGYQGAPGSHQPYQQQGGYAPYQPPPKKKSPWLKILAIGCLGLTVLMIGGCIISYIMIKNFVSGALDEYTSTTPVTLPAADVTEEELTALRDRGQAFADALKAGQPVEPLVLTADDINALIQNHPEWEEAAGKIYVTMDDDLLTGQVSFPLDAFPFPMVKGRFLNGSATLDVSVRNGILYVFLRDLVVNEKPVPQNIMQEIAKENMAKDLHINNPEAAEFFSKIDSLTIEDGRMIITPKP